MAPTSGTDVGPAPAFDTDADLLEGLQRQDPEAARHLVRSCRGRLLAVARRYLPNDADAEDAVQEAFLKAFRALPRFRGEAAVSSWLFRIASNEALMVVRKRARTPDFRQDTLPVDPLALTDAWHDPAAGTESVLIEQERWSMIERAVARLRAPHRDAMTLVYFEGLSIRDAAERLGTTRNAVKLRLVGARKALAAVLAPAVTHEKRTFE